MFDDDVLINAGSIRGSSISRSSPTRGSRLAHCSEKYTKNTGWHKHEREIKKHRSALI